MPTLPDASTVSHRYAEQAAVDSTPATGFGKFWVKNDGTPQFTDDSGTDFDLTAGGGLLTATELTISGGAVTKTQNYHSIDTEADAASDDLDTINGGTTNDLLYIFANDDARTVIIKNGTGNILTFESADISLDEDHKIVSFIYDGTNWREVSNATIAAGGASLPVADTTSIVEGSVDDTKEMRFEVDGLTTATTRVLTVQDVDGTLLVTGGSDVVVADGGSGRSSATAYAVLCGGTTSTGAHQSIASLGSSGQVLTSNGAGALPTFQAAGGGAATSIAILTDEKATTTAGGSTSATTWNARDLNTEQSDPDSIVSISSNQFTPVSGTYRMTAYAGVTKAGRNRLRLYNVTGAAVVQEGMNHVTDSADNVVAPAFVSVRFTANGTDAYRIDHYTELAQASNGFGAPANDGSPEIYMVIVLEQE